MKSVAVIGISSFGYFLALDLARQGADVMAIDIHEDKIEKIKPFVQKAVIADGTDKATLEALGLEDVDGVVVSLGHIEASVLATLHLKELKVKKIIAKALSEEHGKILDMIGATSVVFPEKDMANRVARMVTHENILDLVPLASGYSIIEMAPPASFLHKTLGELDLRRRFGFQVIVIKEMVPENVVLVPTADYVIKDSDVLVMLGSDEDLSKMKKI